MACNINLLRPSYWRDERLKIPVNTREQNFCLPLCFWIGLGLFFLILTYLQRLTLTYKHLYLFTNTVHVLTKINIVYIPTHTCKYMYTCLHLYKWACTGSDRHVPTHTQTNGFKYYFYTHSHSMFLTLDAAACTEGDLWGWLPLVLCVSDFRYSGPNLNTAHRHRETGVGMEGSERGGGRLEERSWELGAVGMSEKIEIGKNWRSGWGDSENDWEWSRWKERLERWWRETVRESNK